MSEDIRKYLDIVKNSTAKILVESSIEEIVNPEQAWALQDRGPGPFDTDKLASAMAEVIDHAILAKNPNIVKMKVVDNGQDSIMKIEASWDLKDIGNKSYDIYFKGMSHPVGNVPFDKLHDLLDKLKEIYFEENWQVLSMSIDNLIIGHTRSA